MGRKCVYLCSIFITLLVSSIDMKEKFYNYSRTVSRYSINRSDGLPQFPKNYRTAEQKNSGPLPSQNSSFYSLFLLCSLVRKYMPSPFYAILSGILGSVSVQKSSLSSTKFLFESKSQYLQNLTANGLSRIKSNIGLLYPTVNVFIPSSGTSYTHEINITLNSTQSLNWRSRLKVEDGTYRAGQQFLKSPTAIHKARSNESLRNCPVYTGKNVPTYVYEYRLSGSKYRQLLAGLALYNLGAISTNRLMYKYHKHYIPQPDEICKFGVRYENGSNDEMAIDCRAITHFILTEQPSLHSDKAMKQPQAPKSTEKPLVRHNSTKYTKKYENIILGSEGAEQNQILYSSYHNTIAHTIKSVKNTMRQQNFMHNEEVLAGNVKTVEKGVVNATDPIFYGKPVNVTSKMVCYVVGSIRSSNMMKAVPCHVLEKYTVLSINSNSEIMIKSLIMVALMFLFCY